MNNNTLKSEILKGLKNGKSKYELYERYSQTANDNLLRRILASRPSQNITKKFRLLHKIVCWLWVLFFTFEVLGALEIFANFDIKILISLVVSAYLLIQLWKFNGDVYLPSIFWLVWGIFNSIKELRSLAKDDVDYDAMIILSWFYISLLIITIALMYIVRKNVFSYYDWFKPAHDEKNQIVFQKL